MPKVGLDASNKSHSIFDTDRFSLKNGEKARVLVLEDQFEVEFVHWNDDEENKGNYICQGAYDTVMANGIDPRCKLCQAADKGGPLKKAKRKFAMLLVVYRTNSKGQVLTPVAVDVVPWVFADDKFSDLLGKKEQWGDLKKHDLMVECIGEQFKKYRIDVLPDAVWLSNAETKALVVASWKEAKAMYDKDLRVLIGRDISDPEKLADLLSSAAGGTAVPDYAAAGTLDSMFADTAAPTPVEVDFTELLDEKKPSVVESDVSFEPAEVPSSEVSGITDEASLDFDDLLK